jgi:predicted transcriptional regulator
MKDKITIPKVKDIMRTKIFYLSPDDSLLAAVEWFNKHHISSAPIINDQKQVVGYLSDIDCIKHISNSLFHGEIQNQTVDSIMSTTVKAITEQTDIFELEDTFIQSHLRHAPVVDSDGHLVGVVARKDVLDCLNELLKKTHPTERAKDIKDLTITERMQMIIKRTP